MLVVGSSCAAVDETSLITRKALKISQVSRISLIKQRPNGWVKVMSDGSVLPLSICPMERIGASKTWVFVRATVVVVTASCSLEENTALHVRRCYKQRKIYQCAP